MEGPLLTKTDHTTIDSDTSSNTDHQHNIDIPINEAESAAWCDPCPGEIGKGCLMDSVLSLVQIAAAIVVLVRAKDEHPGTVVLVWIIGYTCACIAILLNGFLNCVCSSINEKMEFMKKMLEYFFVVWVFLLLWLYSINSLSSLYDNTQHFWLCMAFLGFSCIRYVIPNWKFAAICLIIIPVLWILAVIGSALGQFIYVVFLLVMLIIVKVAQELSLIYF